MKELIDINQKTDINLDILPSLFHAYRAKNIEALNLYYQIKILKMIKKHFIVHTIKRKTKK